MGHFVPVVLHRVLVLLICKSQWNDMQPQVVFFYQYILKIEVYPNIISWLITTKLKMHSSFLSNDMRFHSRISNFIIEHKPWYNVILILPYRTLCLVDHKLIWEYCFHFTFCFRSLHTTTHAFISFVRL